MMLLGIWLGRRLDLEWNEEIELSLNEKSDLL